MSYTEWRKNGNSWHLSSPGGSKTISFSQNSNTLYASYTEKHGREPCNINIPISLDVLTALLAENGYLIQRTHK
jgi:hypothetical protein